MADNPLGDHIQGCVEEGTPGTQERPVLIAWEDAAGNVKVPRLDAAGNVPVDVISSVPITGNVSVVSSVTDTDLTISGSITANGQTVNLPLNGCGGAMIQISGVWTGFPVIEGNTDGNPSDFVAIANRNVLNGVPFSSTFNNGIYVCGVPGLQSVRVRGAGGMTGSMNVTIRAASGSAPVYPLTDITQVYVNQLPTDGLVGSGVQVPGTDSLSQTWVNNVPWEYRGTGGVGIKRFPSFYKTAQASASGNTALWTPVSGHKFRLQRYMIIVTGNAAIAGGATILTIDLQDNVTSLRQQHDVWVPAASIAGPALYVSPWINLEGGLISAAANQVLNINLSATLTSGNVRVIGCGCEEL